MIERLSEIKTQLLGISRRKSGDRKRYKKNDDEKKKEHEKEKRNFSRKYRYQDIIPETLEEVKEFLAEVNNHELMKSKELKVSYKGVGQFVLTNKLGNIIQELTNKQLHALYKNAHQPNSMKGGLIDIKC